MIAPEWPIDITARKIGGEDDRTTDLEESLKKVTLNTVVKSIEDETRNHLQWESTITIEPATIASNDVFDSIISSFAC